MTHKQLKSSHTIICKIKGNGRVVKDAAGLVQIFDYDAGCKSYIQRQMSDEDRRVATEMYAPDPKSVVGYIRFPETDMQNAEVLTPAAYNARQNDLDMREDATGNSVTVLPITRAMRDDIFEL